MIILPAFAIAFILSIAYPAWVCGKVGEPCIGSAQHGIFSMAPFVLFVAFFVAALAGANPVACYAILGAATGSFAWRVGDEINLGGATRRKETSVAGTFRIVDYEIASGDPGVVVTPIDVDAAMAEADADQARRAKRSLEADDDAWRYN